MQHLNLINGLLVFVVAFIAGVMNAFAGGGTLLTFPTLIWMGLNSIAANATSTVALWPFSVGGTLGYRKELRTLERRWLSLAIPGVIGGLSGAILLRLTPSALFDRLVPYLILFATLLFMAQEPIQRKLKSANPEAHRSIGWTVGLMLFELMVGIYGGYFGAGIGIMMLAAMAIIGMTDIHQMNGLKAVLAGVINAVAAIYFIWNRMVYWPYVGLMAVASISGGFAGAGAARKVGGKAVRKVVLLVGFGMAISLFFKN